MASAQVLVVFGSDSDALVYSRIMNSLKQKGIAAELRICSPHRTPKELGLLARKTKASVIVSGGGLGASLSGNIAAQTTKPVIGVPVSSNYAGLDALLGVHQMPAGTPVLGVGVEAVQNAVEACERILKGFGGIKIVKRDKSQELLKRLQKAEETLKELGAPFETIEAPHYERGSVFIDFFDLESTTQQVGSSDAFVIFVPLLAKNSAVEAITMLETTKNGVWMGIGRAENAAIAAVQLLNASSGKFSGQLLAHKKALRKKTILSDKAEGKRFGSGR